MTAPFLADGRCDFYVYIWYRLDTNVPIYVGRGHGSRWKHPMTRNCHNKRVFNTVKKYGGRCELLYENLTNDEANFHERNIIALLGRENLGRGTLYNLTDGGDTVTGWIPNEQTRRKWREARARLPREVYQKIATSLAGRKLSPEARQKLRGRDISEESRAKMRAAKLGRKETPEHRAAIGAAHRGRKITPATLIKMSAAQSNRSPELRAKMGAAISAAKRAKKAQEEMSFT